jgi:hypothetical protein
VDPALKTAAGSCPTCERHRAGPRTARIAMRRARRLQLKSVEIDDFHYDFRNIRCQPRESEP